MMKFDSDPNSEIRRQPHYGCLVSSMRIRRTESAPVLL